MGTFFNNKKNVKFVCIRLALVMTMTTAGMMKACNLLGRVLFTIFVAIRGISSKIDEKKIHFQ